MSHSEMFNLALFAVGVLFTLRVGVISTMLAIVHREREAATAQRAHVHSATEAPSVNPSEIN